jgi:hypothetical protein
MTRAPDPESPPCTDDHGWTAERLLRVLRVLLGILVALATLARLLAGG